MNTSLLVLSFKNTQFDLALCSNYLFLYNNHVNQEQITIGLTNKVRS